MTDWCVIAAVNDEAVLADNLATSPMLRDHPERLVTQRNFRTAGAAYNAGLAQTTARICIFAHQDVYLPAGWDERLMARIAELDALDQNWAVTGPFGISADGMHCGRVWATGLGREIGTSPAAPIPAQSFDELVIILDRESRLQFDADLPSFHLYGTDIAQTALAAGKSTYVIDAPVVHNSRPVITLKGGFEDALNYLRRKWRARLPIRTSVTHVTRFGLKYLMQRIRMRDWPKSRKANQRPAVSVRSAPEIARELGYE